MNRWQFDDAEQQLERVIERADAEGPQIVVRGDEELVVVLAVDEYRRLASRSAD